MYRKSLLNDGECAMVADDDDDDEASAFSRRDSLSLLNDALLNAARHDGRVRKKNSFCIRLFTKILRNSKNLMSLCFVQLFQQSIPYRLLLLNVLFIFLVS